LYGAIERGLGKLPLGAVVLEPILVLAVGKSISLRAVLIVDGLLHGGSTECPIGDELRCQISPRLLKLLAMPVLD
jgi:hypothetical protein